METNLQHRTIKFSEIQTAYYNPRVTLKPKDKEFKDLKKSIETFGVVEPLVINEVNMRLINGHQRVEVMKKIGMDEAVFSIVHIEDEKEEKALNVSLNKIEGKWDKVKLEDLLTGIKDEYNALDLGLTQKEFDNIFNQVSFDDIKHGETVEGLAAMNAVITFESFRIPVSREEFLDFEQRLAREGYVKDAEIQELIKHRLMTYGDTDFTTRED